MKYIIDFNDECTSAQINEWMTANNVTSSKVLAEQSLIFLVDVEKAPEQTDIVSSIVEDANISKTLLNTRVEIIPASTGEMAEYNHESEWWKTVSQYEVDFNTETSIFEKRGAKTTVYVVDSGIHADHPEFVDTQINQLFSFNGDYSDTNGHGTAIASIISGKTLGITSSAVKSVKVFDSSKTTMTSDLVQAFDVVLADILNNQESLAIVNLSWAIEKNAYIEQKIQAIIDAGAFVVVAAGNSGVPIENVTPASMNAVLTIGAYTSDFAPAAFSNYTSDIKNTAGEVNYGALDSWAPGVDIGAALIDGTTGRVSGTSIAAAIATACLAYNSDSMYSTIAITHAARFLLSDLTLSKPNMLTLDDKYASSVNRIVTFMTKQPTEWGQRSYNVVRLAYDNQDMHGFLAQGAYVSKIELDAELPNGLWLSNGFIVGRLTTAPAELQTLTYNVAITYTLGDTTNAKLTLVLMPAGTAPGDVPEDIKPLVPQGCGPNSNYTMCGSYICESGCPNCDPKSNDCPCSQQCM